MLPSSGRRRIRLILCWAAICIALSPTVTSPADEKFITTVAGGGSDRVPALQGHVGDGPSSIALDGHGNLYVAIDRAVSPTVCTTLGIPVQGLYYVHRIDPVGRLTSVVGNGRTPYQGEGGPSVAAQLYARNVASDLEGNLFLGGDYRIWCVDAVSGILTTIAGDGVLGYSGDGGLATSARLGAVYDPTLDHLGNLYFIDDNRVRRIDAVSGIITTVIGNGVRAYSPDGTPAASASLNQALSIALDPEGNLYIGEVGTPFSEDGSRIRVVSASTGLLSTVAGNGSYGFSGDGGPATQASMKNPMGLGLDSHGNLFIADYLNRRVRRVDSTTGVITSLDSGPSGPDTVIVDAEDNLITTGAGKLYHIVPSTGQLTHVAGVGGNYLVAGDGGPATGAVFRGVSVVAVDQGGNLFIGDAYGDRVRRVDAVTGIIQTVAGGGFGPDGGPAISARLRYLAGVAVDSGGNVFLTESVGDGCIVSNRVRRIDAATGIITTVAGGNGTCEFGGDGGPAVAASLCIPIGIAIDQTGNLFIADAGNNRVRRVDAATGVITTVAGNGTFGYLGDGGPATEAFFRSPRGVAPDAAGHLFIADTSNHVVRRVDATTGTVTTVAGSGIAGFAGDGGPAILAQLRSPHSVALDQSGVLFISDMLNDRIRQVDLNTGVITTLAGSAVRGFRGDSGPPALSRLDTPLAIATGPDGSVFVADNQNNRVRRISTLPPAAGSLPCEEGVGERPLSIDYRPGTLSLSLSWGRSCVRTDQDYAVYEGILGDWSSHMPRLCSTVGSRSIDLPAPTGSTYILVVPRNLTREGSYGRGSDGLERLPSAAACLPQQLSGSP